MLSREQRQLVTAQYLHCLPLFPRDSDSRLYLTMRVQRRAPAGGPVVAAAGCWMLVQAVMLDFGAGQVCQDFSADTGAYWCVHNDSNASTSLLFSTIPRGTRQK